MRKKTFFNPEQSSRQVFTVKTNDELGTVQHLLILYKINFVFNVQLGLQHHMNLSDSEVVYKSTTSDVGKIAM